jgi:hypothetical protein
MRKTPAKTPTPSEVITALAESMDQSPEVEYESPQGCRAIVAVADDGDYIFLTKPNLWFFEAESDPKNNGFGDSFDLPAGVYDITFNYHAYKDPESGYVDDWSFSIQESSLLWECAEQLK